MSRTQRFILAALAGAALFTPAAVASADAKPELCEGIGAGALVFPQPDATGHLGARLLDERGVPCFTLEAELTGFLPGCGFGWPGGGARGGVYGYLVEVPAPGTRPGAPFAAVEGTWQLEPDETGHLDLHVYERGAKGTWQKVGAISGQFLSHVVRPTPEGGAVSAQAQEMHVAIDALPKPVVVGGATIAVSMPGVRCLTREVRQIATASAFPGGASGGPSGLLPALGAVPWKRAVGAVSPASSPGFATWQPPVGLGYSALAPVPRKLNTASASGFKSCGEAFVSLDDEQPIDCLRVGRCKLRYVVLH